MPDSARTYRYHIVTFGCQMNKNDSERIASILGGMGLEPTNDPKEADVALINSCSVRQSAEDRVYGLGANWVGLKAAKPELIVCLTGCMPGRDKDGRMRSRLPGVDLYFPTKDMVYLPQRLAEINPNLRPMVDLASDYLSLRPTYQKTCQAYVTIQTGCNHFCTYCVVPFARGLEANRSLRDILDEVRALSAGGCLEVTLLGQIVNHYRAPDPEHFSRLNPYAKNDFAKLLWEINEIPGIARVHWTAPHPLYMDAEVIDALTLPKQVNYLHLPVQSGSNEILERMNRRHTREFYLEVVKKIRSKRPDIALGTDIIVGFSGETEEQFAATVALYKECDFDISYHAQYSPRTGTVAHNIFQDTVPRDEKRRRWWVLQNLLESTVRRKNQAFVGKAVEVLAESSENGWVSGNSREMKRVHFPGGPELAGTLQRVSVERAEEWILWGKPV